METNKNNNMEKEMIKKAMVGKRVVIEYMDDVSAVPSGTMGTITHVDDIGNIHVNWDNGSRLAIVPEDDVFNFV